jgi:hypothetical protein
MTAVLRAQKPTLRPAVLKQGLLDELDWKTTFIAAFSFLFHFGAIGSLYADWTDPVIDDEVRVAQLVESLAQLPGALQVEEKSAPDPAESGAPKEASPRATAAVTKSVNGAPTRASGADKSGSPRPMSEVAAHHLADQITALDGVMRLGLNAPGRATDGVLREGNMPLALLDGIAGNAAGVRSGDGLALQLEGSRGGVIRPGQLGDRTLAGNLVGANVPAEVGKAIDVKKPVGVINVIPPSGGGDILDAARVVSGMRGGFRACYKRGLDENPTMKGAVRITATVGANGEVKSAQPAVSGGTLSSTVVGCLAARVRSAQFSPPSGGGATLVIPILFDVQ